MDNIGVVTIGRNEGERLKRGLASILKQVPDSRRIIYVDSGSTDGSPAYACSLGVAVVDLDLTQPFTAARARNEGFNRLLELWPTLDYVQFLDGDCELVEGWLQAASQALDSSPETVAVCGWRREYEPQASVFNRICDVEWRMGQLGVIPQFGGDVLIRVTAMTAAGGYNNSVIAAEDDDLSVRLRQPGGQIIRIDAQSTRHDAAMHSLGQWWKRGVRAGYGYGQVNHIHGAAPEYKFQPDIRRTWVAGGLIPLLALALAPWSRGLSLALLLRYPLTAVKVAVQMRRRGVLWADSLPWGVSCAFAVFPGLVGLLQYRLNRAFNRPGQIIEYKELQL